MKEVIMSFGAQDYIALCIVAAAAAAAALYMKKRKNKGCCGSCSGCAFAGDCRNKKENENEPTGTENKLPSGAGEDNKDA